jgi:PEP-CTERM motif-containing protein
LNIDVRFATGKGEFRSGLAPGANLPWRDLMRKLVLLLTLLTAWVAAYAGPVEVAFVRFNNSGQWQNGYPYWLLVQGMGFEPVMCDDYLRGGDPAFNWLANQTNLGTGDLSLTRFGNQNGALTLYDEAGWLLLQTRQTGINQWQEMNSAAWNLFDPSAPCDGGCQFWLAAAMKAADGGFHGIDFSLVSILTPVEDQHGNDPLGPQEFLYWTNGFGDCAYCPPAGSGGFTPGGSTPEPGTFLLVGAGAAVLWRRKRMG